MVNVKVSLVYTFEQGFDELCAKVANDNGDGQDIAEFQAFAREWYDSDREDWTFGTACEDGFDMLQNDAQEIFGASAKVYSTGRQGGWAVVEGLPDIESWDAIMLSKWSRFCK